MTLLQGIFAVVYAVGAVVLLTMPIAHHRRIRWVWDRCRDEVAERPDLAVTLPKAVIDTDTRILARKAAARALSTDTATETPIEPCQWQNPSIDRKAR